MVVCVCMPTCASFFVIVCPCHIIEKTHMSYVPWYSMPDHGIQFDRFLDKLFLVYSKLVAVT